MPLSSMTLYKSSNLGSPKIDMGGCILYLPFYRPDMGGATIYSKNASRTTWTSTETIWSSSGRYFDKTNDKLISTPVITSAMWQRTADFSICGWVNCTDIDANFKIIIGLGQSAEGYSMGIFYLITSDTGGGTKGRLSLDVRDNTNQQVDRWRTDDNTNLADATWYFVGVSQSGSTITFNVNGANAPATHITTGTINGASFANVRTCIGCNSYWSAGIEQFASFFGGYIKELLAYNRALSANDFMKIYQATK